jgi:hypothetical protein
MRESEEILNGTIGYCGSVQSAGINFEGTKKVEKVRTDMYRGINLSIHGKDSREE